MALVGNYNVLNKSPARWMAGNSTAIASGIGAGQHSHLRSAYNRNSDWRNFSLQERATPSTVLRYTSKPDGYGGTGWALPTKAGGLSAVNQLTGLGVIASASGAGGVNGSAALTGLGNLTSTGQLVVSGVAALTGTGTLTGDVLAALVGSADLTGTGTLTASLLATGALSSPLTGTGTLTITSYAVGFMSCDIIPPIILEAQAWSAQMLDQELVETGLTVRETLRLVAAATAGKISGGGTSTVTIRSAVADGADRIVATVDTEGNRTAITYDLD